MQKMIVTDLVTKGGAVIAALGDKITVWTKVEDLTAIGQTYIELDVLYEENGVINPIPKTVKFLNKPPIFIILGDEREIETDQDEKQATSPKPTPKGEVHVKLT